MRRGLRTMVALAAVLAVAATACGGDDAESTDAGLANPASEYCVEQGGRVEQELTAAGERGVCVLPDGTRVDEWELYRGRETTSTTAAAGCSAAGLDPDVRDDPALPAEVAAMRADLARAAATCDYDALAELADRGGRAVRFSWGDDRDPVAFWQAAEETGARPAPLRTLRLLLDLPAAETDDGSGHVQYVWPAAFATEHPTSAQLAEVAGTGLYDLEALERWVDEGVNYLGYRILVTASGDWTAFVAGD